MATAIAGWAHTPFGTYDNESVESLIASSQGTGVGRFCLQGLPPKVKIGVRLVGAGKCTAPACWWSSWLGSHVISPLSAQARASKQYQEQTASLQTALLPETYRAGHDMSRTGVPYLKTGEQA